jgi:hypothetical protein
MNFKPPSFSAPHLPDFTTHKLASGTVARIENQITSYAANLEVDEAYGVHALLKDGTRISATWFGYHNPYMVIIEGTNDKRQSVRLLLHMNEVQIVLIKDKKDVFKDRPAIGFQNDNTTEEDTKEN